MLFIYFAEILENIVCIYFTPLGESPWMSVFGARVQNEGVGFACFVQRNTTANSIPAPNSDAVGSPRVRVHLTCPEIKNTILRSLLDYDASNPRILRLASLLSNDRAGCLPQKLLPSCSVSGRRESGRVVYKSSETEVTYLRRSRSVPLWDRIRLEEGEAMVSWKCTHVWHVCCRFRSSLWGLFVGC